jgi:hypothetical protein
VAKNGSLDEAGFLASLTHINTAGKGARARRRADAPD